MDRTDTSLPIAPPHAAGDATTLSSIAIGNPQSAIRNPPGSGLFWFAVLSASCTLLLIAAGALVTSLGVGLAVPDWPTTFGRNMFLFDWLGSEGGVFYEHGHRLLGSAVGFLTLVLCGWLWLREPRGWVRQIGGLALTLVILQGVLGGQRVVRLDARFAIVHGALAQAFFALMTALALFVSRGWTAAAEPLPVADARRLRLLAVGTAGAVYFQSILGALLRHTGAVGFLHLHLAAALAVAVCVAAVGWAAGADRAALAPLRGPARVLTGLLAVQIGLGIAAWKTTFDGAALLPPSEAQVAVTTVHVCIGAAMLAAAVVLALRSFRHLAPAAGEENPGGAAPSASGHAAMCRARPPSRAADFVALTKPRILFLALVTVVVGGMAAAAGRPDWGALAHALAGTALVAAGASALNHLLERDVDARMKRTAGRPLPSGRVSPGEALAFGLILSAAGLAHLLWTVDARTACLAAATLVSYVGLYTPLKRVTSLNTAVGAVPGALPTLIGWSATGGPLDGAAASLFGIVFLWQFPHFLAIAWMYREDYAQAGLKMLSVVDAPAGRMTGRQAANYCIALLPVSLLPTVFGVAGPAYFVGAAALGIAYLAFAVRFAAAGSLAAARQLLRASVVYLPLLFALLLMDLP